MRLKERQREGALLRLLRRRRGLALAAYTLAVALVGAWAYRSGLVGDGVFALRSALEERLVQAGALLRARPEVVRIDIKHRDWLHIAQKREEALRRNLLVTGPEDFVPAEIRHGDDAMRVRMRLKGDLRDHWAGDKWSFRVEVRDGGALFGMKRFSLQHPRTREYLWEWLFHRALAREGLVALRYRFVRLVLNGRDLGVYALEEHFDKRLVEHGERREGPIVRFDEDRSWAEAVTQGFLTGERRARAGAGSWYSSEVDGFDSSRWLEDPERRAVYERALALLDGFRDGSLSTSDVFDVPLLARFFAVTEVFDAPHAAGWRNVRLYYNPVTSKLEPIGFDARGHGPSAVRSLIYTIPLLHDTDREDVRLYEYAWFEALFRDPAFYAAYVAALQDVSRPAWLDGLLADVRDDMRAALDILHTEFPGFRFWDGVVRANQAYVRSILDPAKGLHAWLAGPEPAAGAHALEAEIGNVQFLPVDLLGVALGDARADLPEPVRIDGKDPKRPVSYRRFTLALPEGAAWSPERLAELRVRYRIAGTGRVREEPFLPRRRPAALAERRDELLLPAPNAESFDCLTVDRDAGRVAFRPGSWTIDRDLVLPEGFRLVCGPATELDLAAGASIVARGPLELEGSEDEPIRVRSSQKDGGGLAVLGAGGPSVLRHVVFEDLAAPERGAWALTGAVTFYESDVRIDHCAFRASRSEDALNVVRSDFDLDTTLFEATASDAFDADFCAGRIASCSFVGCGNDAIDVSGTYLEVEGSSVSGAGDKGLSIGESSEAHVRATRVEGAVIGAASKDLSQLALDDVQLAGCRYGLAAYQKKAEFGPSTIRATGLALERVETPYLVEAGSSVEVDGEALAAGARGVYATLYPEEPGE
jgi:CotH kinase protein